MLLLGSFPVCVYGIEYSPPPGWIRANINSEAPYYKGADPSSGILGYFSRGAEVIVSPVPENDYYQVFFPTPINRSKYAWIPSHAIDIDQSIVESQRLVVEIPKSQKKYAHYLVIGGVLSGISPSDVQSKLGESPYGFLTLDYKAEFGFKVISIVDLNIQMRSNSFEHSVQGYSAPVNYYLNGLSTMLGIQLHILRAGSFEFLAGGGAGLSFNSGGNNVQFFKINTDGLMGYPAFWQGRFQYLLGRVGINADFGYLYHKVENVPILNFPIGETQSTASIDMSGFYGALGVNLHF